MRRIYTFVLIPFLFMLTGCGTTTPTVVKVQKVQEDKIQVTPKVEQNLKRKVAIARFGNEAQYGKSALFGLNNNYNAEKQATDVLSAKLAESGKFILLERSDIDKVNKETNTYNLKSLNIGSDYLIVGSVTEFGRKDVSDTGVFTRSKFQTAYAKVSVRLVEVATGQIIFAQEGSGEASSEGGTAFGVGTHVGYDSTLNDKAISSAISSVVDGIMQNLLNKPWRSYVLSIENNIVMIAGGKLQGLKIGDQFKVYQKGKSIVNPQTGIPIELPGMEVANIKVISQFGSSYTNEGSVCQIISGQIAGFNTKDIYIEK